MKHSHQQQNATSSSKKHFSRKRGIIIGVVATVLVLGGATATWLLQPHQQTSAPRQPTASNSSLDKLSADAETLANSGKTAEAKAAYDSAVASTADSSQKAILLLDKAMVSLNEGNIDEALLTAQASEALSQNSNVDQFIAGIYETKGNTVKAIEYYKKAIPLINKNSPMAASDAQYFQSRVDELSGVKN